MQEIDKYGKVFTVRLQFEKAERFTQYIEIREEPVNDILTEAIDEYLDRKSGEQPLFEIDLQNF